MGSPTHEAVAIAVTALLFGTGVALLTGWVIVGGVRGVRVRDELLDPTTSGASAERAELLVRDWEADAEARGVPRLERTFWEGAAEWTSARAHPNRARRG